MSSAQRGWRRLFPAELASDDTADWSALLDGPAAPDGGELWAQLAQATDARFERPCARPGVLIEQLPDDNGAILSDHERGVYVHLPPENLFLWERMDGTRTQVDLVVDYCLRYKAIAQARVAGLIESLRAEELLAEPADQLYLKLRERLLKSTPMGRVNQIIQTFLQHEFAISGIDQAIGRIYQAGGWLLYTWPAQMLLWLLGGAGLVAFLLQLRGGQFSVLGDGTLVEGALLLFLFQIIALFLHELAHALTVKAFGRRVRRAGLLLLYGMPGAFVDTTDIWPAGKRAQLAVTWAGPFCNLVLGGITSLLITAYPGGRLAPLAFQFAVSQYVLVAFNLTPFIRLDGYYLLADWLQIANLRPRALGFLRNGLPYRIRQAWSEGRLLPTLNREERILVVFGAISVLWVVNLFGLAVITAPVRLARVVERLVSSGSAGRSPLAIFFMLTGALLTTLLLIRGTVMLRQWLQNIARMLQRAPAWRVALVFAALALLVAAIPDLLAAQQATQAAAVYAATIELTAAGLASLYALRLAGELRGGRLCIALRGLLISTLALVSVDAWFALGTLLPAVVPRLPTALPLLWLLALLPALGGALLAATALIQLYRAALSWSVLLVMLAVGTFALAALAPATATGSLFPLAGHTLLVAALLLHWQLVRRPLVTTRVSISLQNGDPATLLRTTAATVAGELVTSLGEIAGRSAQLQLAASFNRQAASADWPLWLTMEGQLGDQCTGPVEQCAPIYRAALADLHGRIAATLGRALANDVQTQALAELPRPLRAIFYRWVADQHPQGDEAIGVDDDRVRLRLAGRRLAETLVIGCARVYGWPLTDDAIGAFNRTAAVAGWPLYVRGNGRLADELHGDLLAIAQTYREILQDLLGRVAAIAGIAFIERGVVQVYDSLPWEAREVTEALLFSRISWSRRLTRVNQAHARSGDADRHSFLRSIPLIGWLPPDDLAALETDLTLRRVRAGRVVVARNTYLDHTLIVRRGSMQAITTTGLVRRVVEEIGVGDIIGVRSILDDRPVPYEYLAQTDVELWKLPRAVVKHRLGPLLHIQDALEQEHGKLALLAQIPLFAGLDARQSAEVARALEIAYLEAGSVVLAEGAESSGFYIVQSGEIDVLVRAAGGGERLLSTLSSGEFFGEMALLRRDTVNATVRARTAVQLLRLPPAAFYALLCDNLAAPLEQVQTRRAKERARLVQTAVSEEQHADV
jgi:CRP-like cAMP-binding protein